MENNTVEENIMKSLFVEVPVELCEQFRNAYVVSSKSRLTDYDNKIVFLSDKHEIFSKGNIYSASIDDLASLTKIVNSLIDYIGDIPEGYESASIVDYISEYINKTFVSITNEEIDSLF